MQSLQGWLSTLSEYIWSEYVLIPLLAGTGVYLMIGLRAMPWRHIPLAFKRLWQGRALTEEEGDIPPFQALMTALSATIGTGNIVGVATAIYFGGPGAIFWMWLIALFGMATKYAEAVLAVTYRETDEIGQHVGGPMYYIRNGLGERWNWLGLCFAFFGMFAAFGIGNMVQSNSVAHELHNNLDLPAWITGLILATLAGLVILGGIRRIGKVVERLVPTMALIYIGAALLILILNFPLLPTAFSLIISDAFTGQAAAGGSIWMVIRWGVSRGIFSNEAGLGSAPIAHAAARTKDPITQGMIAMLGTFIDTIIVCSMTALVIIVTGAWDSGLEGAPMTSMAFQAGIHEIGSYVVTFGLVVFAFTTILGWSYYGERCAEFIFGVKVILPYRLLWIIAIFIGAEGAADKFEIIWTFADVFNGLMALPNLVALLLLSPAIFKITRDYFEQRSRTT